jgi:hydrogenase maturation protease
LLKIDDHALTDGRSLAGLANSARLDTILIGLGNPIMGDDGVGWRVVQEVQTRLAEKPLSQSHKLIESRLAIETLCLGGLSLMEHLVGYRSAVLVDAVETGQHDPGDLLNFSLDEIPEIHVSHLASAHDTSLQTAVTLGRSLGLPLPGKILVVGIEIHVSYEFSESLSPAVAAAIPGAANSVIDLLDAQFAATNPNPYQSTLAEQGKH